MRSSCAALLLLAEVVAGTTCASHFPVDMLQRRLLATIHYIPTNMVDEYQTNLDSFVTNYYSKQENHSVLIFAPAGEIGAAIAAITGCDAPFTRYKLHISVADEGRPGEPMFGDVYKWLSPAGVEFLFVGARVEPPRDYRNTSVAHCAGRDWSYGYVLHAGVQAAFHMLRLPPLRRFDFFVKVDTDITFVRPMPDLAMLLARSPHVQLFHTATQRSNDCENGVGAALERYQALHGPPVSHNAWCAERVAVRLYTNFVGFRTSFATSQTTLSLSAYLYQTEWRGYFEKRWQEQGAYVAFACQSLVAPSLDGNSSAAVLDLTWLRNAIFVHGGVHKHRASAELQTNGLSLAAFEKWKHGSKPRAKRSKPPSDTKPARQATGHKGGVAKRGMPKGTRAATTDPTATTDTTAVLSEEWQGYRVGDVVRFQDFYANPLFKQQKSAWERLQRRRAVLQDQRDKFPSSIGSEYVRRAQISYDWRAYVEALANVSRAMPPSALVKDAAEGRLVVVGLRLGDSFGRHQARYEYAYTVDEYARAAAGLAQLGLTRAVFVGGIWNPWGCGQECMSKNRAFLHELRATFERAGFQVTESLGQPPDADLVLYHVAKFYLAPKWSGFHFNAVAARAYERPVLMTALDSSAYSPTGTPHGIGGPETGLGGVAGRSWACPAPPIVPPIRYRDDLGPLLRELRLSGPGVELGVFRGFYTEILLSGWRTCSQYVQVDAWRPLANYADSGNRPTKVMQGFRSEAATTLRRMVDAGFAKSGVQCANFTTECAKKYPDGHFDFVYVDARHDYLGVLNDLSVWWPKLKAGGLMAGHDFTMQAEPPPSQNAWKRIQYALRLPPGMKEADARTDPARTNMDWRLNFDGSRDPTGRSVRGAVEDFFSGVAAGQFGSPSELRHCPRQLSIAYREPAWNVWMVRK